ncbi:hypothetical protein [Campylobacter mucosalis]|uniref:hypothetical protein n=1 Tax=Campylobacter mucosalis TaxID=202 RepID=UPI0014707B03|nr:hypothetical protein [Campylobacter mucosalis]
MKVALINKNPAVARLITLSLNKIGVSYIELDDASLLDQKVDFAIVDSDVDVSDDELSAYATKVMHLIPRGAQKIGEICLEKPFLPTEFIAVFEQNKPQDNVTKDDKFASDTFVDADNLNINLDDFELPDLSEPSDDEGIDDLGLHLNSEAKIDDGEEEDSLDLSQMSFDENDEQKDPQGLEREKVDLNELTELQEMAPMDISLDDEATSDDESIGSILDDIDAIKDDELPELPNSDVDAFNTLDIDDSVDDIEQIKSALDEIDSNDSVSDELARLGVDGTLDDIGDEILKDDIESVEYDNEVKEALMSEEINPSELSIADENFDTDDNSDTLMQAMSEEVVENEAISDEQILGINELDENLGLDENDRTLEPESENIALELDSEEVALELDDNKENLEPDSKEESLESQEENLELDDAMDLMASDKVAEISQDEQNTATFDSIDDIDENSMMSALGLAVSQSTQSAKTTQKPNNDIKAELEQTITKHLMDSLDDSSIKDALKGMNIKINISFEEK